MKTFVKLIITAVLLLTTGHIQAQTAIYPIQINAVMLPPYTNCLGDYFNSGANRVQVKAILRDISKYDNSLRFSLSVKVKTGNTVVLESVTPYPIELSNANVINDLRDYVSLLFTPEAENRGVRSKGNYANNGYCLPEGSYEFVFQAFDFYKRNVPLSEPFSMFCYLNQAEPPVAVYPEDGACGVNKAIGLYDNGVQFQWMDPIAYGPSNKVYEFVLTEKSNSTNLAANMFSEITAENKMMMPVFSDKVNNNTFRYVPLSANFQKGKEYCWYVVAKGGNITGEKDGYYAFKNNGVSNKNCFTYGECPAKEEIFDNTKVKKTDDKLKVVLEKVDVNEDEKNAEAFWKAENGDFCKYYVYYYRSDLTDASAEKAVIDGLSSLSTVLKNLEPGKEYACYVIGATNCNKENEPEILSPKSNEYKFKLAEIKMGSDNCEANLELMACDNLLETLDVKDYFYGTTSGEIITVTKITNKGSDNSFSGEGIVSCTLLKNKLGLNVKFDNIYINSDRYLCKGEVRVVHNDVDNLVINLNDFAGKKQGADKAKQQENLGTEVNNLDEAKNYKNQTIIYNGELYAVDSEGNPEKVGKVLKADETCDLPSSGLDNEDGVIVFDVEKGLNGEKYDPYIDKSPSPFTAELVKKSYEWQYSTYPIAWISMVEGEVRWITAEIGDKRQSESTLKLEDIDFYCYAADGNAVKLDKETYGNKVKLKIYGGKKNTSLKIYARKKAEKVDGQCPGDEKTVGVVNIYSMSHQTKKILLAPVLNEMTLNIEQMQNEVNKMFAPLGKTFEFTKGNAFTSELEPELDLILMDGINTTDGAKHFSKETDEMIYIRQRYSQFASDFSDYDACLFLIPTAQKLGLQGYMPLNKRVGYIIVGENSDVKLDANTIAHELCHGLYDIQHVFDYNGVGEGDLPENIMDYPELGSNVNERYLTKYYQWVGIENGQLIHLSFLDDTEDAEFGWTCLPIGLAKWALGKVVEDGLTDLFNLESDEDKPKSWGEYFDKKVFTSESARSLGIALFDECTEQFGWKRVAGVAALLNSLYNMYDECKDKTGCSDVCNCYAKNGINILLDQTLNGLKIITSRKAHELKKKSQNNAKYDEKSLSEKFSKWVLDSFGLEEEDFKHKTGMTVFPPTIDGAINVIFKYISQKGANLICSLICPPNAPTNTPFPPTSPNPPVQIMGEDIEVEIINEVVTVSVKSNATLTEIIVSGGYDKNLKWPEDALVLSNGMNAERNCSDNLNYAGGGSKADPFKIEKINCISYVMYRFKLPDCDKNPVIVTGYAKTNTGKLIDNWDYDKRDCGISIEDAMNLLNESKKTNRTTKKEDTPKVEQKIIRLSKKDKLKIYTKYCCWYVDNVDQYTICDKKRQQEASCFLKANASNFVSSIKSSMSNNMYAIYNYLTSKYSSDEITSEMDISYTDEYDLVKTIYNEISNELKTISAEDLVDFNVNKKLTDLDKLNDSQLNAFNAIFLKALVNYSSRKYWDSQLNGPEWFNLLDLPLQDKSYCDVKNASCSEKD